MSSQWQPPLDGVSAEIDDGIAVITLSNPGRRNAFYPEMRNQLCAVLKRCELDDNVKAVIITGAEGNFCAGADLKRVNAGPPMTVLEMRDRFKGMGLLASAIMESVKPVIAAVEGDAFGAGLSMAVAADVVVASVSSRFGTSFANIGLLPDMGLLYTLPKRVGDTRAKALLMTGGIVPGEQAVALGIADELAADGAALDAAKAIARRYNSSARLTVAMVKAAFARGICSLEDALRFEMDVAPLLLQSDEHKSALAAFVGKKAGDRL